jgi:hypothetical protein
MKKLIFLFLFCIIFPSFLMAETAEDNRRMEEEKRESLRSTEEQLYPEKQPRPEQPPEYIDLSYFRELFSKRVAFLSDATKALVILLGVQDQKKDFASQIAFLKEKNIIPKKDIKELSQHKPLRKGLAAYMFCQALEIKGGIWLRLFGLNQRYALKELVFEEIMLPGNLNDIVSGKELVVIFTNAAEYLAKRTIAMHNEAKY